MKSGRFTNRSQFGGESARRYKSKPKAGIDFSSRRFAIRSRLSAAWNLRSLEQAEMPIPQFEAIGVAQRFRRLVFCKSKPMAGVAGWCLPQFEAKVGCFANRSQVVAATWDPRSCEQAETPIPQFKAKIVRVHRCRPQALDTMSEVGRWPMEWRDSLQVAEADTERNYSDVCDCSTRSWSCSREMRSDARKAVIWP